jgi:hypothetical protein
MNTIPDDNCYYYIIQIVINFLLEGGLESVSNYTSKELSDLLTDHLERGYR